MTKEEVILSLGLDNAEVATGIKGTDFLIQNSVAGTLKSLKHLVRINMVTMGIELLHLWDGFTKQLSEMVYDNAGKEQEGKELDAHRKMLKTVLKDEEKDDADRLKRREKLHDLEAKTEELKGRNKLEASNPFEKERIEGERKLLQEKLDAAEQAYLLERDNPKSDAVDVQELYNKKLEAEGDLLRYNNDVKKAADEEDKERFETNRKKKADDLKFDLELLETKERAMQQAESRLERAKTSRLQFTLEDLAKDQGRDTPWGNQANDILQLRQWAKWNAMRGFSDKANWQINRADQLTENLKQQNPFLVDPMEELKNSAERTAVALEFFKQSGIDVNVQD